MIAFVVMFLAIAPSATGGPLETLIERRVGSFPSLAVCQKWADGEARKFTSLPKGWRVRGECRPLPRETTT